MGRFIDNLNIPVLGTVYTRAREDAKSGEVLVKGRVEEEGAVGAIGEGFSVIASNSDTILRDVFNVIKNMDVPEKSKQKLLDALKEKESIEMENLFEDLFGAIESILKIDPRVVFAKGTPAGVGNVMYHMINNKNFDYKKGKKEKTLKEGIGFEQSHAKNYSAETQNKIKEIQRKMIQKTFDSWKGAAYHENIQDESRSFLYKNSIEEAVDEFCFVMSKELHLLPEEIKNIFLEKSVNSYLDKNKLNRNDLMVQYWPTEKVA